MFSMIILAACMYKNFLNLNSSRIEESNRSNQSKDGTGYVETLDGVESRVKVSFGRLLKSCNLAVRIIKPRLLLLIVDANSKLKVRPVRRNFRRFHL